MALTGSPAPTPDSVPAELPTPAARLTISLRPAGLDASAAVPAGQAPALITTFAVLATGTAGLGSAVATLSIRPSHAWLLALAELGFALTISVLIVTCRHAPPGQKNQRRGQAAISMRARRALPRSRSGPS